MSTGSAPWKALIRLAWRDTTRHKGRTALVIALIGVPVAMLLMASVLIRTTILSVDDERLVQLGPVADFVVGAGGLPDDRGGTTTPPIGEPPLPAGARAVAVDEGNGVRMPIAGHPERKGRPEFVNTVTGLFTDPILSGYYLLRSGAWPVTDDAVAITDSLAGYANLKIGDTIDLITPKRTVRVTGVFEQRDNLVPHTFATASVLTSSTAPASRSFWVDLGPQATVLDAKKVAEGLWLKGWPKRSPELFPGLFQTGLSASYKTAQQDSEATPIAIMNVAGVILLFLLGTIVTAAFAVGARRQLRTLGLIAANGGDPRQLRRLVTLQGTVAAAVGALCGFALGGIGLAVVLPHLNDFTHRILPGVELAPFDVIIAFVMALLAGSLAAAIPGRAVAKVPVLNALGGRRPLKQLSNALPVAGLVIAGLGAALVAAAAAPGKIGGAWGFAALGGIMVLLGGVIIAPWLVGRLGAVAPRLGGSGRLAVRRLTRHRSRSGPIVAAIMATGAVAIAVSTISNSITRGQRERYSPYVALDQVFVGSNQGYGYYGDSQGPLVPPDDPAVLDEVSRAIVEILPGSKAVRYGSVAAPFGPATDGRWYRLADPTAGLGRFSPSVSIVVGNVELLRALRMSDALIDAFTSGRALASGPVASSSIDLIEQTESRAPLALDQRPVEPTERHIRFPAVVAPTVDLGTRNGGTTCDERDVCTQTHTTVLILPEALAAANDIPHSPEVTVFAPGPLNKQQRNALRNLQQDLYDAAEKRADYSPSGQVVLQIHYENNTFAPVVLIELILTGLALLLALGVTGMSLALTATDNRADDTTLASLGASPKIRRRLRAWEAWLLAAMGMALAIPFGFIPAAAIIQVQRNHDPLVFPWLTVGLLLVAVPCIAAAIGWVSTRSPRRVATTAE
jgi:putative ABC transport system permease protein